MINAHYRLGGAETVMHQLASGLRAAGHACTLALPSLGKAVRPRHVTLLYPRWLDRLRYTRWSAVVERLFPARRWQGRTLERLGTRSGRIFHLHSFTGYAEISALARLARRRPLVWTLHAYWGDSRFVEGRGTPYEAAWGLAPQLLRRPRTMPELAALQAELEPLLATPLHVVFPSSAATEAARRCPALAQWQIHHLPNGVAIEPLPLPRRTAEARRQAGLHPGKQVLLVVNRDFAIADKGFPMVAEALGNLGAAEGWQVLLVGHHASEAATKLPSSLEVHAREFVADPSVMRSLYGLAEIFLFASVRENLPCVTLEAMAAECAVVATPTDGLTEQITDGENGFLASAITGPALNEALERALANPSLRLSVAQAGRACVLARFSERTMIESYLRLYRTLQAEDPCPA